MAFTFRGQPSVSWRWRTFKAIKRQQNDRKCWKNLRSHLQRPLLSNLWACRHRWDQLCSLPGDLNRKFEHAPHYREFVPWFLTIDQKPQHVNVCLELQEKANEDPTFISRIIAGDKSWTCFINWKWNWRDDILKQYLTSKGNHKRYSTVTSTVLLKHGKNDRIAVYVHKETILKEMEAKID
jgi:hypothetical protein